MKKTRLSPPISRPLYFDELLRTLENSLTKRLHACFNETEPAPAPCSLDPLPADNSDTPLSKFIRDNKLDMESQYLLLLALTPFLKAELFDKAIQAAIPGAGDYPQLGGFRGRQHRGFLPTGETVLFLLAGDEMDLRLYWQEQLKGEHPLFKKGVVYLDMPMANEPPMSGHLVLDSEYAELFLTGKVRAPRMSLQFPAQHLVTEMEWDDLVLPKMTMDQVLELQNWVQYSEILMEQWGM